MIKSGVTIMDGGMGQELYRRKIRGHDVLWSANALITDPDVVRDIHLEYIKSGARILITNTYCTNPDRMRRAELPPEKASELTALACRLAIEAREQSGHEDVIVAGSLPPLYGSYRPDIERLEAQMLDEYTVMVDAMKPYVDVILCETMTTSAEAQAAAKASSGAGLPIWMAWTLSDEHPAQLRSDESVAQAFEDVKDFDIQAFFVNCCAPESVLPALEVLKAHTNKPLGAYANGFTPIPKNWAVDIDALGVRKDIGPQAYADYAEKWVDAGARIIGGCCEIGPAHIQELSARFG